MRKLLITKHNSLRINDCLYRAQTHTLLRYKNETNKIMNRSDVHNIFRLDRENFDAFYFTIDIFRYVLRHYYIYVQENIPINAQFNDNCKTIIVNLNFLIHLQLIINKAD